MPLLVNAPDRLTDGTLVVPRQAYALRSVCAAMAVTV